MAKKLDHAFLIYGDRQFDEVLNHYRRMFDEGYLLGLGIVLERCQKARRPLPDWAAERLGEFLSAIATGEKITSGKSGAFKSLGGEYLAYLKPRLRSDVYATIMDLQRNPRRYTRMPTSVIKRWFDGEIEHRPEGTTKAEHALDLAFQALKGTPSHCTSLSTLRARRYTRPGGKDEELVAIFDQFYVFGQWDIEVTFGLRPPGRFWGPPCQPPDDIAEIIKQAPKVYDKNHYGLGE